MKEIKECNITTLDGLSILTIASPINFVVTNGVLNIVDTEMLKLPFTLETDNGYKICFSYIDSVSKEVVKSEVVVAQDCIGTLLVNLDDAVYIRDRLTSRLDRFVSKIQIIHVINGNEFVQEEISSCCLKELSIFDKLTSGNITIGIVAGILTLTAIFAVYVFSNFM